MTNLANLSTPGGRTMNTKAYLTTGAFITAMKKLFHVRIRVTGAENLVDRPTLFAANHFTRLETLLIPYMINECVGRPVRSLATDELFRGLLGKYLRTVGTMSVRDPWRNRTIVRDLMTGHYDWVIYPEGGLIKNKKTVEGSRLRLTHPERKGPPRTGAAVLALKAEIVKRRYRRACAQNDVDRLRYYEEAYGLTAPEELCPKDTVVVPVNLTFYPIRPGRNPISVLARLLSPNLNPRIDEELQFEGTIIFDECEIIAHFGEPLEVADYLDLPTTVARRVAGLFSETRTELFLRRQATRLTSDCMRRIYQNTQVNLDHLFCYGLRALKRDRVPVEDFHRALYLAAASLQNRRDVRLHPVLSNGITALLTGDPFAPLQSAIDLAKAQGVIERDNGCYVINREVLHREQAFHEVRLSSTVQVIANELEPVRPAVSAVKRSVNLTPIRLRKQTAQAILDRDIGSFHQDYETWHDPEHSKDRKLGEPFFYRSANRSVGVVLAHGYLSSPEQIRPLADALYEQGCSVYGVRLGGHGTSPDHLLDVRWSHWLSSMQQGYLVLRDHCERVVVGGFSLGGTLALLLAARHGDAVDGLFTINAPMGLRDWRAAFVSPLVRMNSLLRGLRLHGGHYRLINDRSENPDLNYPLDYLHGIRELRRAVRASRRCLPQVTTPALVIQSRNDPLIAAASAERIARSIRSEERERLVIPIDRHDVFRGPGSELTLHEVPQFVQRCVAQTLLP